MQRISIAPQLIIDLRSDTLNNTYAIDSTQQNSYAHPSFKAPQSPKAEDAIQKISNKIEIIEEKVPKISNNGRKKWEEINQVTLDIAERVPNKAIEAASTSVSLWNQTKLATIDAINATGQKRSNTKQKTKNATEVVEKKTNEASDVANWVDDQIKERKILLTNETHNMMNDKVNQGQGDLNHKQEELKQTSNGAIHVESNVVRSMLDKAGAVKKSLALSLANAKQDAFDKAANAKSSVVENWGDIAQATIDKAVDAKVDILDKWDQIKYADSLDFAQSAKNKVVDIKADSDAIDHVDKIKQASSSIVVDKIVDAKDGISVMSNGIQQTSLEDVQATIDMFKEGRQSTNEKVGDLREAGWNKVVQGKQIADEKIDRAMVSLAEKFGEANVNLEQTIEAIVDKAKQVATKVGDATKEASFNVGRVASKKVVQIKNNVVGFAQQMSDDVTEVAKTTKDNISSP